MASIKDFDEARIVEYTDEELKSMMKEIEMKVSVLSADCAEEMAVYFKDENFDMYSFSGSRKIKKISKKYSSLFDGANYLKSVINKEIAKREQYAEEQRYSGRSVKSDKPEMTKEEFIEKEQDKTWAMRSKIE